MAIINQDVYLLAEKLLASGMEELSARDRHIIERIAARVAISRDVGKEFQEQMTFGEHLADKVAEFGGSWSFIIIFVVILLSWAGANVWLLNKPFDPYPFIFLNLMLSMLAALQAPIIMMSQNRQAARDRMNAQQDYEVNLKAELEIMALHQKIDALRDRDLSALRADMQRMLGRH